MKQNKKISVLLSVSLVVSMLLTPIGVMADETSEPSERPSIEITEPPELSATKETVETTKPTETTKTAETAISSESETTVETSRETEPSESEKSAETSESVGSSETTTQQEPEITEKTRPEANVKRKAKNSRTGKAGDNLIWTLDDEGTMIISGTGEMDLDGSDEEHRKSDWANCKFDTKKVIVENGVTSICTNAFARFKLLTSVTLPDSIKSIGDYAFDQCEKLQSINLPSGLTKIEIGTFRETAITSIVIPESVTTVDCDAFSGCYMLTNITLPNSVKTIGDEAFCGCVALTSIDIPDNVTTIYYKVFAGCEGLTSIKLPDGLEAIDREAFHGCKSLTSITIPNSVTHVGWWAFCDCEKLKHVTISKELFDDLITNNWGIGSAARFDDESSIIFTFSTQAANPLRIKGKTAKVKYKKLRKKNLSLSVSKIISFTRKGQGALSYAKTSGNKRIKINKTTGKVTIKKKLKRGTYKVKIKVKAAGNEQYKASGWKTVTVKIKVK